MLLLLGLLWLWWLALLAVPNLYFNRRGSRLSEYDRTNSELMLLGLGIPIILGAVIPGLSPTLRVILVLLGVLGPSLYYGFRFPHSEEPSQALIDHREKLLKEYTETTTKPKNFWGLRSSPVKTQMLAHFKTGYPKLKIAETYDECEKLLADSGVSLDKLSTEIQKGLDSIRTTYGPPRNILYAPPRSFDDNVVLQRIIGKIGTPEWTDYALTGSNWPAYSNVTSDQNTAIVAILNGDNKPEEFVRDLNVCCHKTEPDVAGYRLIRGKFDDAHNRFDNAIAKVLQDANLSFLEGKCEVCKSL
jgi:hypothetical protein